MLAEADNINNTLVYSQASEVEVSLWTVIVFESIWDGIRGGFFPQLPLKFHHHVKVCSMRNSIHIVWKK